MELQNINNNDTAYSAISKINTNFEALGTAIDEIEPSVVPVVVDALQRPCKIFAHRGNYYGTKVGNTGGVGTNTLGALYNASLQGFDGVEIDVMMCSDNVFVLSHDLTITDAVSGITYTIAEITSQQATSIVVSNESKYGVQYVPTLEDALKVCYFYNLECQLDLKPMVGRTQEEITAGLTSIIDMVFNTGMEGKVYYALNNYLSVDNINFFLNKDSKAKFFGSNAATVRNLLSNLSSDIRQRFYLYTYSGGSNYDVEDVEAARNIGVQLLMINVGATNSQSAQIAFTHYPNMIQSEPMYSLAQVINIINQLKPFAQFDSNI